MRLEGHGKCGRATYFDFLRVAHTARFLEEDTEPAFALNLMLDSNYEYLSNSVNICEVSSVWQTLC